MAVAVLAPSLAGVVGSAPTEAWAAPPLPKFGPAIDALSPFQGQTGCSPAPKRGVLAFRNLMLKTYKGSRNLGISRGCGAGGRSEHKEGRAFDWGVRVNKANERKAADDLIRWLLKADAQGNPYALARRMGVMYIIWNKKIWGSYEADAGFRSYHGRSPHTDHVHISFSRLGAQGKVSYWGAAPALYADQGPAPLWDPEPEGRDGYALEPKVTEPPSPPFAAVADERVSLDARISDPVATRMVLQEGQRYVLEARGVYEYGRGPADAECSLDKSSGRSWRRNRWRELVRDGDNLDVYVGEQALQWEPVREGREGCNVSDHAYRLTIVPEASGRLPLRIFDTYYGDNRGTLDVAIYVLGDREPPTEEVWEVEAAAEDIVVAGAPPPAPGSVGPALDTMLIDTRRSGPVAGHVELEKGTTYVVESVGTYTYGDDITADAECAGASDGWKPSRYQQNRDDVLDLYIGDRPVRWLPTRPDVNGCNSTDHVYRVAVTPLATGPLSARLFDTYYNDNRGILTVRLYRADDGDRGITRIAVAPAGPDVPVAGPPPPAPPAIGPVFDTVLLNTRSDKVVAGRGNLVAGAVYVLEASGAYEPGTGGQADAECTTAKNDAAWRPNRYPNEKGDFLDLYVGDKPVQWLATVPDDQGCAPDHVYRMSITPASTGALSLRLRDSSYADNKGTLSVKVYGGTGALGTPTPVATAPVGTAAGGAPLPQAPAVDGTVLETLTVDTRRSSVLASRASLVAGRRYVLEASGTYDSGSGMADVECVQDGNVWRVDKYTDERNGDVLDLYVGESNVRWLPVKADADGCSSSDHVYRLAIVPSSAGPLSVRLNDTYHGDNKGSLAVKIYGEGASAAAPAPDLPAAPPPVTVVPAPSNAPVASAPGNLPQPTGTQLEKIKIDSQTDNFIGRVRLEPGDYVFEVSGVWEPGDGGKVDAACSITKTDRTWRQGRIPDRRLRFLGAPLAWVPTSADVEGCNSRDNTYRALVRVGAETLNLLQLVDDSYVNNKGELSVKVFRAKP